MGLIQAISSYSPHWPLTSAKLVPLALATLALCLFGLFQKSKYPPGPKALPLLGHIFQVPQEKTWIYFQELGPVIRLSLAGDEFIVLNRAVDAEELLNHRSKNYSSRKAFIYSGKYQSDNKRIIFLPDGQELRRHRSAYHAIMQPKALRTYEDLQENGAIVLLSKLTRIINNDLDFVFKHYTGSFVYSLTYGKRIGSDDKDIKAVIEIVDTFVKDSYPGAHLVHYLPVLDLLPDFLAPWRNEARMKHKKDMKLYGRLIMEVKDKLGNDDGVSNCLAARLWKNNMVLKSDAVSLAYAAGTAFEAGMDTSAATLLWFVSAMLLYPEHQKRAQDEIDAVVGCDGLNVPGFAHMDRLPFTFALVKELFRWRPALPAGIPHCTDEDDSYMGYRIRAKTTVIPNIWAMNHDEDHFDEPATFNPKRYMRNDSIDMNPVNLTEDHFTFGFGRRFCPGKSLAGESVWIAVVRILWAFNIKPDVNAAGEPVHVNLDDCTSGIVTKPKLVPARFIPRSEQHIVLIRRKCDAAIGRH